MPIKITLSPEPSFDKLKAHFADSHPDPDDQSSHIPHKVYNVHISSLLKGERFDSVEHVAWRYVFHGDDGESHVAEVSLEQEGQNAQFHHTNSGNHVDQFIDIINEVDEHRFSHNQVLALDMNYEISLLRAPACYVVAVWFNSENGEHSFLVPLAPTHHYFNAGHHYEPDIFIDLLAKIAHEIVDVQEGADTIEPELAGDDFSQILGVDEAIANILNNAGITHVKQLVGIPPLEIMHILVSGGVEFNPASFEIVSRFDETDGEVILKINPAELYNMMMEGVDPLAILVATWPLQLTLLAERKWDHLANFQAEIKSRLGF